MDLGTVVDRRPDLRERGAGPIQIARLPSSRGGAICDSGATVAFITTTANVGGTPMALADRQEPSPSQWTWGPS